VWLVEATTPWVVARAVARRELLTKQHHTKFEGKLMQPFKRKYVPQKVTPELKEKFLDYLWTMCEAVVISPNKKDTRKVDGKDERKFHYYSIPNVSSTTAAVNFRATVGLPVSDIQMIQH
jgi:hypothetical protein